ncbi:MAG: glycoside hydrolase family 127 protein [Anaerolineae bacterium]|nr:glycoside hydrolase family 127 protein [Anaerolineae bacterium]
MVNNGLPLSSIRSNQVKIDGGYWGERQATVRTSTIPAIHHQLEITHRTDAWHLHGGENDPRFDGHIVHKFWDSDLAKWIEAVGYSLDSYPDPDLEQLADKVIQAIKEGQLEDGYLNSFFTVIEPQNKWRNLRDWHELYDAGHLMEGAAAYYQGTGKRVLLDTLARYADHIDARFGPGEQQVHGYCGHPEVELGLVKLYRATGEKRYLNLAKYFVDERGQEPNFFDIEAAARGDDPTKFWAKTYHYCQAHKPLREQNVATGHSVRAAYLYAGAADISAETGDSTLLDACRVIWEDLTSKQMYITGGLGPAHANEGFTFGYDLPNESAYAETCASIALVFWAKSMFDIDPDSRYTDVMERALYNGIMSGVSWEGNQFFYANPLASYPYVNPHEHFSGINTPKHYRRQDWFVCPCCPPNLARVTANLGHYFSSHSADTIYLHLYNHSHMRVNLPAGSVQIDQETNYPWNGDVSLTVRVAQSTPFKLALRIPNWASNFTLRVNGATVSANVQRGYAFIDRTWNKGDTVELALPMSVERIVSHPNVRHNAGTVALQRGPVVYCLEEADNGPNLANLVIPRTAKLVGNVDSSLFSGVGVITGEAVRTEPAVWASGLYQPQSALQYSYDAVPFKAIPYSLWANREPGEMRVWVREQ